MFSILTITLSLFNENQQLFYQNDQRKKLYSVQYERKFSEYLYCLCMLKNKNVHAFLTLHCKTTVFFKRINETLVICIYE